VSIRIVLADDHPVVLAGLQDLFSAEPDIGVVARCQTGDDVFDAVRKHRPDVIVLDYRMPGMSPRELLRAIAQAKLSTAVAIYTANIDKSEMLEVVRLGVRGVVLKEMPPRLLVECVRAVHAGNYWLEKNVTAQALETVLRQQAGARRVGDLLTDREIEITRAVATGLRNKAIAGRFNISEGTVKVHLHNIYQKLELDGRHALATYAREHGLV
jgi:DNA-binding NarL/FixJ family response regulator